MTRVPLLAVACAVLAPAIPRVQADIAIPVAEWNHAGDIARFLFGADGR